jgi:hypothetical protein
VNDDAIEREIFRLLDARDVSSSICPSDVARVLADDDHWRGLMDDVRSVAGRLAQQGRVRITQGEKTVDIETVRGPIRIRRISEGD